MAHVYDGRRAVPTPPWLPPSGEFLDLCLANLWNTPMDQLEMAANNFAEFSQMAINRTQVDM